MKRQHAATQSTASQQQPAASLRARIDAAVVTCDSLPLSRGVRSDRPRTALLPAAKRMQPPTTPERLTKRRRVASDSSGDILVLPKSSSPMPVPDPVCIAELKRGAARFMNRPAIDDEDID